MKKTIGLLLLVSASLVAVGCGSSERTITPKEEAEWRKPHKGQAPAYYHGAEVGPPTGGPPPNAAKPPGQ